MRHWYCPVVFPEKMKMKHSHPSGAGATDATNDGGCIDSSAGGGGASPAAAADDNAPAPAVPAAPVPAAAAAAAAADDDDAADDALRGMYRHGWRRGDVGKGAEEWTSDEEAELLRLRVEEALSWEETASRLGTGRTPKQCRERRVERSRVQAFHQSIHTPTNDKKYLPALHRIMLRRVIIPKEV